MEQDAITLLNNLDLNVDNYTIRIRIVRLWTRADFNNARKVYCYDMIVMDSEGTKMQAFVLAKNASGYQRLLEEKRCLTIRSPSLDVIGFVVKSFPFEVDMETNNGKTQKKVTFMLEDLKYLFIFSSLLFLIILSFLCYVF
ncbi:putative nucleic acid-binding protein [Helianthus annuus]|nr:putative nucleic acid-binding protein [Helianthus annuus]